MVTAKNRIAIFDLDNTLIDTSKLEELRKSRDWNKVYKNLQETYLNPKIKKFVEKLVNETFTEVFIVTSSPKSYAKKLLKYHNFLTEKKIVGYHDTTLKKPNPDPYLMALKNIDCFDEVYIFGDDEKDFIAAEKLKNIIKKKVFKVGCSWYVKCNYSNLDRELTVEEI